LPNLVPRSDAADILEIILIDSPWTIRIRGHCMPMQSNMTGRSCWFCDNPNED